MSRSKAKNIEARFATGGTVPAGAEVLLTFDQADSRRHLLHPKEGGEWHRDASDRRRLAFVLDKPAYFKAGEQLTVVGEVDRGLAMALGLDAPKEPPSQAKVTSDLDRAREEGIAAGRAAMLAEVEAYNAALDKADEFEDAATAAEEAAKDEKDVAKKAALDATATEARKVADEATAHAATLKPKA